MLCMSHVSCYIRKVSSPEHLSLPSPEVKRAIYPTPILLEPSFGEIGRGDSSAVFRTDEGGRCSVAKVNIAFAAEQHGKEHDGDAIYTAAVERAAFEQKQHDELRGSEIGPYIQETKVRVQPAVFQKQLLEQTNETGSTHPTANYQSRKASWCCYPTVVKVESYMPEVDAQNRGECVVATAIGKSEFYFEERGDLTLERFTQLQACAAQGGDLDGELNVEDARELAAELATVQWRLLFDADNRVWGNDIEILLKITNDPDNDALKDELAKFARSCATYSHRTGHTPDIIGKDNIIFSRNSDGDWKTALPDPVFPVNGLREMHRYFLDNGGNGECIDGMQDDIDELAPGSFLAMLNYVRALNLFALMSHKGGVFQAPLDIRCPNFDPSKAPVAIGHDQWLGIQNRLQTFVEESKRLIYKVDI